MKNAIIVLLGIGATALATTSYIQHKRIRQLETENKKLRTALNVDEVILSAHRDDFDLHDWECHILAHLNPELLESF